MATAQVFPSHLYRGKTEREVGDSPLASDLVLIYNEDFYGVLVT